MVCLRDKVAACNCTVARCTKSRDKIAGVTSAALERQIDRRADGLTDVVSMQCVADELAAAHVVLLAVDVDAPHAPHQTTRDARPLSDQ